MTRNSNSETQNSNSEGTLYRVRRNVIMPDNRMLLEGAVLGLSEYAAQTLARLERRGTISQVAAPPLEMLQGWAERGEVLQKGGIGDLVKLLMAGPEGLAGRCGLPMREAQLWVKQAKTILEVKP